MLSMGRIVIESLTEKEDEIGEEATPHVTRIYQMRRRDSLETTADPVLKLGV
jgi:hypothetical protein